MRFAPFSKKQLRVLTWWRPGSPDRQKDAILCDGAVRSGKTLAQLLQNLQLFPQELINVRLRKDQNWQENQALKAMQTEAEHALAGQGRVLIRASGTEPLVRIMVEAQQAQQAHDWAQRLADTLRN